VTSTASTRAVLMGAPDFFSIRGGANPHTRTVWGLRKRVGRDAAISQWRGFATRLVELGVEVYVVPADPAWPGLVYPANAGALLPLESREPIQDKHFVLSNLIETRAGEKAIYRAFLTGLGFRTAEIRSRFEGEADFFPVGDDLYLFTYGRVVRQRFELAMGLPPWRRRYGFRSERAAELELRPFAGDREILPLELRLEAFYHGDTCLAAFGANRRFVLAYLDALTPPSQERLRARLGDRVLPLAERDAAIYAANAFRLEIAGRERLFLPRGVSTRLQEALRECGVEAVPVDVSEFWTKGGGSVKCMIGDLGPIAPATPADAEAFRSRVRYGGSVEEA
jgi:N-dimethylarginine dimethylaminohydrolase